VRVRNEPELGLGGPPSVDCTRLGSEPPALSPYSSALRLLTKYRPQPPERHSPNPPVTVIVVLAGVVQHRQKPQLGSEERENSEADGRSVRTTRATVSRAIRVLDRSVTTTSAPTASISE